MNDHNLPSMSMFPSHKAMKHDPQIIAQSANLTPEECFIALFRWMQNEVHMTALEKGWYDKPKWVQEALDLDIPDHIKAGIEDSTDRNEGECLMLMVTEIAEGMEGLRKALMDDKLPHRRMIECELADVIIRAMDNAQARGYDVAGAIVEKHAYNKTREYRHGKKF